MGTSEDSRGNKVNYDDTPHFVNAKGKHLFCRYWQAQPADQPRAIVFVLHGAGEHCGYYDKIAKKLAAESILVCAHDHVGHGRSEGARVHIDSFDEYTNDMLQHMEIVKKSHPGCPIFLVGHSMGGTITLKTVLEKPDLIHGMVLIGPAIVASPESATPFKVFMAKAIAKALPQCPVGAIQSNWICQDPAIREQYDTDPLVHHGGMKAKWAVCMLNTLSDIQARLAKIKLPFMVLHGEEDKLTELTGSKMLHQLSSSSDKTLKTYPGGYHQVHNEPNGVGEGVVRDIVAWITERL